MDEEAIDEFVKNNGLIAKEKTELFLDIECVKSFYLFSFKNKLRIFLYKITNHKNFEKFIMSLIFLSTIKLVFDTYLSDESEEDKKIIEISEMLDIVF